MAGTASVGDGPEPHVEAAERQSVRLNRYNQATSAGLTEVEAWLFADSETDIGLLRKLVRKGATVDQIRRIVL